MNAMPIQESGPGVAVVSKKAPLERAALMEMAASTLAYLHGRVTARQYRERKDDAARLAHARATMQGIGIAAALLRDADLDDLNTRLSELEKRRSA
ncbi:MAG: hypothetical protein BWY85_00668 [Firmicutes bacterium ADurb.Bin506]|nr:MAG: hypothetical protein BWY85_00668 [Firmicutes bacterium ADurb.Bin506]